MPWPFSQRSPRKSHPNPSVSHHSDARPMTLISLARMHVILQVESFGSWDLFANAAYSYLWFSKTCVSLLSIWSHLASVLLKSFSDHVSSRETHWPKGIWDFSKIDLGNCWCQWSTCLSLMGAAKFHVGVFMGSFTEKSVLFKRPILKRH